MNLQTKSFGEILYNINNLTSEFYIETIEDMIQFADENERKELYQAFITKVKHEIVNNKDYINDEELKEEISNISNILIAKDSSIEEMLLENNFNFENIKTEREEKNIEYIREIDLITNKIDELETKYEEMFSLNLILEELMKEKEKINESLSSLKENFEENYEEIKELEALSISLESDYQELLATTETLTNEKKEELSTKYNFSLEQINRKVKRAINTKDILDKELETITAELGKIESSEVLDKKINELNAKREKMADESWIKENAYKEPNSEKDEKEKLFEFYQELGKTIQEVDEEINKLEQQKEKREFLENDLSERKTMKQELDELKELKFVKSTYDMILKDVALKFEKSSKIKTLSEDVEKSINDHSRIVKLDKYANSSKLKQELHNDVIGIVKPQVIKKAEKNHKLLIKALSGVSGFALGICLSSVTGVGQIRMAISVAKLSAHTVKKGINKLDIWSKNNPSDKIQAIRNTVISAGKTLNDKVDRVKEGVSNTRPVNFAKEKISKHPEIKKFGDNFRNFLKEQQPNINCFLNGVSIGYITGNTIEMLTGKTFFEHVKDAVEPKSNVAYETMSDHKIPELDDKTNSVIEETTPPEPVVEDTTIFEDTTIIEDIPIITEPIIPNPGDVFDLSSLTEGYTSADSIFPVDVMESLAKEVTFDKAVELPNGKVMWHFKRLNGAGYAWFDSEVIKELITKTESISKIAR